MADVTDTIDLASRLRRDAETTSLPLYASLMRRAAEEIEAFSRLAESVPAEQQAG